MTNSYQRMVLEWYMAKMQEIRGERRARLARVKTRRAAETYRGWARREARRAFGRMPAKSALNAKTTGTCRLKGCRIENVLFESRPGFLVSANLYVPDALDAPAPGVVGTCGHALEGKAAPLYQAFAQALVKNGFVVLLYDPIDQGERDQYDGLGKTRHPRGCCAAHNMIGKQLELVGDFFGAWRAWDGIRAHDYLRARPEVDSRRIGVTGNSGGGTLSTWLWALDPRFAAAAPSCFVTSFHHNLTNELPADCEQCPPGLIGAGAEHADLLIAAAPKPLLLLGQKYDFFDRRGLKEAYEEVSQLSRLLGARKGDVELFLGPTTHGYSSHNREAMVAFFARHLGTTYRKCRVTPLPEQTLYASRRGVVVRAGSRRSYQLVRERAAALARARKRVPKKALPGLLRRVLQIPRSGGVPDYRILRRSGVPAGAPANVGRFAVMTEPGISVLLKSVGKGRGRLMQIDPGRHISVWVPHTDSWADMQNDRLARSLHKTGSAFYVDVRGLGESLPEAEPGQFCAPYKMDYMLHAHGLMMGESYLGRRIFDLLRTLALLRAEGAQRIDLYGRGLGAVIALFAACLDPEIGRVTLKHDFDSYEALVKVPTTPWPASIMPRGLLKEVDLPDCHAYLGRKLKRVAPWGANPPSRELAGA